MLETGCWMVDAGCWKGFQQTKYMKIISAKRSIKIVVMMVADIKIDFKKIFALQL